tara:strand:- start:790 stop:1641 length:852 start_codon:yes stop_codon:yes gene_type:complete
METKLPIVIYPTMTKKEAQKVVEYITTGLIPSQEQWVTILTTLHVRIALQCVLNIKEMESYCLVPVVKRQHQRLFQEVVRKIKQIPLNTINILMTVNAFYLYTCLNQGLDPNGLMTNGHCPLSFACRYNRLQHIQTLLGNSKIIVSRNLCRFMLRHRPQHRFVSRAIQLCTDITPDLIPEALEANISAALIIIMEKLEEKFKGNSIWMEMGHLLRCPISLEFTTDLVQTPSKHIFDRVCLLTWVNSHSSNPMTREQLHESDFIKRREFLPVLIEELQQKIQQL